MNKSNKQRILYCTAVSMLLAVFGAICLYLAVDGEYSAGLGLFTSSAVFAPALYFVIVLGAATGIVLWVLFRKTAVADKPLPVSVPFLLGSALTALTLLIATGYSLLNSIAASGTELAVIQYLSWLFGALAAASVIVGMFCDGKSVSPVSSLLSFFPPLYCASVVLSMYFDKTVAVNSPLKLLMQLAFIFYMLMFTAETGISLGRGRLFPRYLFTLACSVAAGGSVSLGALAVCLAGTTVFPYHITTVASCAAICVYAAVRAISCMNAEIGPAPRINKNNAPEKSQVASGDTATDDIETDENENKNN